MIIEETNEINVKWNYLQPLLRDMVKNNENAANEQKYIDHLGKFFKLQFIVHLTDMSTKF